MFELVVPARDEAEYVGQLVSWARSSFGSRVTIIVVDNASHDGTPGVAEAAGADKILREERAGKGYAVTTGLRNCSSSHVMLCDADIAGLTAEAVCCLRTCVIRSSVPMGRLSIGRPPEDAPVTTLLARPLLSALGFTEATGCEPLGGLMMVAREFILDQHLPGGWGFDVACTLATAKSGHRVFEVPVSGVSHRHKPLADYIEMAEEVCMAALRATGRLPWNHSDCTRCNS